MDARERRERIETFDLDEALKAALVAPLAHAGDLWLLGGHRLLCGDSLDASQVERLMGGAKAQMAISDPPYNVDYGNHGGAPKGGKKRTIQNDDLGEGFYEFQVSACRDLISATDGAVYICMSSPELHTLQRAFCVAGGHWSTFVVWAKDTFTLGRYDYQRQYEPILYGWREGTKHYWLGDRDQGDVWSIEKPLSNPLHPTMKPLSLFERAIENRNVEPGTKLTARHKKQEYSAEVVAGEDGKVRYKLPDGREFKSLSSAGTAITDKACNGWAFWSVEAEEVEAQEEGTG